MPVRRRSLRELWRNDTCVWSDSGTKKLPFAGYSVAAAFGRLRSLQIVWDDLRTSRADIWRVADEGPQANKFRRRAAPRRIEFPGGHRRGVTPVPIPNTEVKPSTADGTACESVWESRSLPGVFPQARCESVGPFLFVAGSRFAGSRVARRQPAPGGAAHLQSGAS